MNPEADGEPGMPDEVREPEEPGERDELPVERPSRRFRVVAWFAITCLRLARWRVRTRGLRHIPPKGGAVITWNHTSHVDFVVTAYEVYRQLDRPVRVLARADLWDSWRTRWIVRFADAVPVTRSDRASRASSYTAAVEVLQRGGLVLVAPEGRISTTFEVQPMRTGAVRMARQAGVPIVPSASWGSHRLVTTGYPFSPRRAWGIPVEVAFGPALEPGADASGATDRRAGAGPDPRADPVADRRADPVADLRTDAVPHPDADAGADPRADARSEHGPVVATMHLQRRTTELLHELQRIYPDGSPAGAWWVPARLGGAAPALETTGGDRSQLDERPPTGHDAAEPGSAP